MDSNLLNENEFRLFKAEDKHAFKMVYDNYFGLIHYIANRCGAEPYMCDDIIQETFIRLHSHIEQIRDQTHLKNWLSMTARNLSMDLVRKRSVENKFKQQEIHKEQCNDVDKQSENCQKHMIFSTNSDIHELELLLIGKLIDQVTAETKDNTFSLFYRDGLSAKEIAAKQNAPVSTITNRLSRLRKRFQSYFEQHIKQLHEEIL